MFMFKASCISMPQLQIIRVGKIRKAQHPNTPRQAEGMSCTIHPGDVLCLVKTPKTVKDGRLGDLGDWKGAE